jgi:catechol 2,3-dioxygenase-like lactoylglutathione lyase family enzyme
MIKFMGPIILVNDVTHSRTFYETLLGLKVQYDFGVNASFEGGLAIHLKSHFQGLLGDPLNFPVTQKAHNGDLVFETDELILVSERLQNAGVAFIHPVIEQPWGQRLLRCYDPDGHILEIGETMEETVRRLRLQGWTNEEIREKTGMPPDFTDLVY